MLNRCSLVALAWCVTAVAGQRYEPPIRALLITGHNNHNWAYTSRVHEDTLEATGRFEVDITENPAATLAASDLSRYRVFVLDYNDLHEPRRWGPEAEAAFVNAVAAGAGVVAIHSANNAFAGWDDYERMLGLMWRDGAGHGSFHGFEVAPEAVAHPIIDGLPAFTTTDELYHGLSNPRGSPYTLLARAMSERTTGGTGTPEPVALAISFGAGRVFATPLGHVWNGDDSTKVSVVSPGFRALLTRGAEWAATGAVTLGPVWKDTRVPNQLTDDQMTEGWILLFDGLTPTYWRGYKQADMPAHGWTVVDGTLHHAAGSGGGDIVTRDQFGDFEFECEWKVGPGGNSGIFYRGTEEFGNIWETGLEMQVLDDARHNDGKNPKTRAGTLYDLVACAADVSRPAGEWNHARIIARGTRVQHWLNGVMVVDIDLASDEYKAAHAGSKWPSMPQMGTRPRGHIALQDHGDDVWYRNLRVRELKD